MKLILLIIAFFTTSLISSQVLNGNQNTIAEFYDGDVTQINLNGGKLEFQYKIYDSPLLFFRNEDEVKIRTAVKKDAIFIDGGFTNTKSFLDFRKIDFKNIGYSLGMTYQNSFSRIITRDGTSNLLVNKLRTFTTSLKLSFDRFDNFDPESEKIKNELPAKLSLRGGYNRYYFYEKVTFVRAINLKVNLIDNNASSLSNYLLNDNITGINNISIDNQGSFDGKFGIIDNNLISTYFSIGVPIIFSKKTFAGYIAPIPHLSWETFNKAKPRYNAGLGLGFLGKPIIDKEVKIKKEGEENDKKEYSYRKFNAPSFLSVGIDWNTQGGQGSEPNYYVSGTFKF